MVHIIEASIMHAHINDKTLIRSFNKKYKIYSGNYRPLKVQSAPALQSQRLFYIKGRTCTDRQRNRW